MLLAEALDGGQPVVGGDDLVAFGADEGGDGPHHRWVVIDDEDSEGAGAHRDHGPRSNGCDGSDGDCGRHGDDESRAVRFGGLAPEVGAHRFPEPLGGVEADPGSAGGVGVAAGVRLEDPLAPFVRDARSLVRDAEPDDALIERPVDPDGGVRRRVLDRVLDEVLDDLAEPRRVGEGLEPDARHDLDLVLLEDGPERPDDLGDEDSEVDRGDRRRPSGTTRTEARIESTRRSSRSICSSVARCQVARALAPLHVARFAAAQRRLVREQVGVGADDRERRPKLVGDERDELAAGLVDRLERLDPRLGLGLLAALLDDPGEEVGDRAELGDVVRR